MFESGTLNRKQYVIELFKYSSSLQSDSSDDDDPFAEIDEEEFTEYDENEAYEREQSLHITTEVESLTEQLETATGTQIEEVADKL
ncbi:hypothetical protein SARC_12464, partial [Sphaeroforma arctica JP610]